MLQQPVLQPEDKQLILRVGFETLPELLRNSAFQVKMESPPSDNREISSLSTPSPSQVQGLQTQFVEKNVKKTRQTTTPLSLHHSLFSCKAIRLNEMKSSGNRVFFFRLWHSTTKPHKNRNLNSLSAVTGSYLVWINNERATERCNDIRYYQEKKQTEKAPAYFQRELTVRNKKY